MIRAHKIRIYPNNVQATMLLKHCGVARLTYNVCLDKWSEDNEKGVKHDYASISKWWDSIKTEKYPFVNEVNKGVQVSAIGDLQNAFRRFSKKLSEPPKFHKKGVNDSFRISGGNVKVNEYKLHLPNGLVIKMAEPLRYFKSKIINVTVLRKADKWFASIACEIADSENQADGIVGVDLGINPLVTLSDGTKYENPCIEQKFRRRLARAHSNLNRKKKDSKNYNKARKKFARLHYRAACVRKDYAHKFTTEVTQRYGTVCLENLYVESMLVDDDHDFARALYDAALYEVRRQFEYKAKKTLYVGQSEYSSKTCNVCDYYSSDLKQSDGEWVCPKCKTKHDRDENAAKNILRWAFSGS